ncbi:MAG: hypothetical protein LBQ58_06410 [Synergistaceae bacterium]|nr:hypothetical protein [Synergistaceae bacterium]
MCLCRYRSWLKCFVMVLSLIVLLLNPLVSTASTMTDFIKIEVTGENVNVRSEPSMNGKIITQADSWMYYIAESQPIRDKKDNSSWYKLIFIIDYYYDTFSRLDKSSEYNFVTPYINAKFVKKMPLSEDYKREIEYFRKGRPVRYNTGDIVPKNSIETRISTTKKPHTLFLEPKEGAKKQTFPAGTKISVYGGPDIDVPSYMECSGVLYYHKDMNDKYWFPVFDANLRIIGWAERTDDLPR